MHFPFPQRNLSSDGPLGPQLENKSKVIKEPELRVCVDSYILRNLKNSLGL